MYYEKGNLRDISWKMRDAGFDESFRDCPAKGGTGGHPAWQTEGLCRSSLQIPTSYNSSCEMNGHLE
jgi:hypothetical protein